MSQFPQSHQRRVMPYASGDQATDVTVSSFFNAVYAWMAVGLALTAAVAWYVANSGMVVVLYGHGLGGLLAVSLVAFGIAWYVQSNVARLSTGVATGLFLLYAAIIGALSSALFLIYPLSTLTSAFMLTAGTFGVMSVYGFVTKRDLTRIGSIAVMLALGFIVASIVNLFLASNFLSWIITYAILALFVVITAYETQRLKFMAEQLRGNPQLASRYAIVGSLVLYISFMNMFYSILRILGGRR
jgi:FtsH-binding integral membrane protein